MKNRVTIRIGAAHYDARVNVDGQVVYFDLSQMTREQRKAFRVTLVREFRRASAS